MGVGWRTIGYDDPRTAEVVGGKTTMMDLATVVLVFKWGYNLRQSVHAAGCEMAFILTVVALHEWGHALAELRGGALERLLHLRGDVRGGAGVSRRHHRQRVADRYLRRLLPLAPVPG